MFNADDTIVAVSSPAGAGARAIVRLSGPDAMPLADAVFTSPTGPLAGLGGFHRSAGLLRVDAGGTSMELPACAYVFRAPRSYTRQDIAELHLPGCLPAVSALLAGFVRAGAREAQPGEFTARAFFSGRIDLSQAEAVADVIHAADSARLRVAQAGLGGQVYRLCKESSEQAADVLAEVEASIDLADEDVSIASPATLAEQASAIALRLRQAVQSAVEVPETADEPRVVLAGLPNVGKSSLMNAFIGTDRAIVSALAGTTRDVLSAAMNLNSQCVVLQDVAGLAQADPDDALSSASYSAARAAVARAEAICFVVDLSAGNFATDLTLLAEVRQANPGAPVMLIGNKADLLAPQRAADAQRKLADSAGLPVLVVSAVAGAGLGELRDALAKTLHLAASRSGEAMGLHRRQKRCLTQAGEAMDRCADLLRDVWQASEVAELAAVELRAALAHTGQVSGQVVTEDVLGRIFARFCVGK